MTLKQFLDFVLAFTSLLVFTLRYFNCERFSEFLVANWFHNSKFVAFKLFKAWTQSFLEWVLIYRSDLHFSFDKVIFLTISVWHLHCERFTFFFLLNNKWQLHILIELIHIYQTFFIVNINPFLLHLLTLVKDICAITL